jgi:hypothetical protein
MKGFDAMVTLAVGAWTGHRAMPHVTEHLQRELWAQLGQIPERWQVTPPRTYRH